MQTGLNLQELLEKVIADSNAKQDFIENTDNLRLHTDGCLDVLEREPFLATQTKESFKMTEQAHRQIAARLKIPQKHYLELWDRHPDLVCHTVNELFEREPETRMLRTLNGKARAFLSNSYKRLDNDIVLQNTLPAMQKLDCKILSSQVTDTKLYLKVLFPNTEVEIGTAPDGSPDIVHSGFILRNSEVGSGSLNITAFFYRTFCENGCHFGGEDMFNFKRTHIGSKITNVGELFSDTTRDTETRLIAQQCTDIINNLNNDLFLSKMANRLRALKDTNRATDPMETITVLSRDMGLRDAEARMALESFLVDGDFTQWGAMNAITNVANNEEISYDRATEIEAVGSKIIALPSNKWNRYSMLEAA